jgi:hypothetical protein
MNKFTYVFASSCLIVALANGCGPKGANDSDDQGDNDDNDDDTGESGETGDGDGDQDTGESGDGDGDGDGCGNFICVDMGEPSCSPGLQDCPDDEKCTGYVMTPGYCCVDANKCVEIIGDKQLGDVCERMPENDDCAKGLFCMTKTSGDTGSGVCLAYCDINSPGACADAGLPDAKCIPFNDGELPLCEVPCDPLTQDCVQPQGCYGASDGFVCTLPGYEDGKGNDNDDCFTVQSCKPGLLCANGMGQEGCQSDRCCTPFCECDPDNPNGVPAPECSGAEQCLCYFAENAPPEYLTVGLCYTPE